MSASGGAVPCKQGPSNPKCPQSAPPPTLGDYEIELALTARLPDGRSLTVIADSFADADERLACAMARELRHAAL